MYASKGHFYEKGGGSFLAVCYCTLLSAASDLSVASCSVTSIQPSWRVWWWMGANRRNGQNASRSLYLVKVLWSSPPPPPLLMLCPVTQHRKKAEISHVTPTQESGPGCKADRLTYICKKKIDEKENHGGDWCYTDYILRAVWEISFGFFIPKEEEEEEEEKHK